MQENLSRRFQLYLLGLATGQKKGPLVAVLKAVLFLFSLLYGLLVRLLIVWYSLRPYRAGCKVISVGNITLGGTGKTSLVEYIAKYLHSQGRKVAVLSRGYKRQAQSCGSMGDEPYMLSQNLAGVPVISGSNRINSLKEAVKEYKADTVIIDDAMQQWKIKKDLEIVAVDALNPFGNGRLIPRGILREPLSSLKRADIFVITKTNLQGSAGDLAARLKKINPKALIVESEHALVGFYDLQDKNKNVSQEILRQKPVGLICGIGDPDSFEAMVRNMGIKIGISFKFADHHAYVQDELDQISGECKEKGIDIIITTQKDAVRLQGLRIAHDAQRIAVLRIALKITKNDSLFNNRLL